MGSTFKCTIAFTLGAVAGSLVAWKILKTKYEQLAQEEINSVKEVFSKREKESKSEAVDEHEEIFTDNVVRETPEDVKKQNIDYRNIIKTNNYTNHQDINSEDKPKIKSKPYVISPSEFGELDDYENVSLTYYSDQILTDEDDEIVEDVENTVGFKSLTHFGEYEDDSVFVRNDELKCDYEILYDTRRYTDVIRKKPHPRED